MLYCERFEARGVDVFQLRENNVESLLPELKMQCPRQSHESIHFFDAEQAGFVEVERFLQMPLLCVFGVKDAAAGAAWVWALQGRQNREGR